MFEIVAGFLNGSMLGGSDRTKTVVERIETREVKGNPCNAASGLLDAWDMRPPKPPIDSTKDPRRFVNLPMECR